MTRSHRQQAIRSRQIAELDAVDDRKPLTDLSDVDSSLSKRRLVINRQLSLEDGQLFIAQLDNQPPDVQSEAMALWEDHLRACRIFQKLRTQGLLGNVTVEDLAIWLERVVETAEAILRWSPPKSTHNLPQKLSKAYRDARKLRESGGFKV